jgi:hypothetical protein
LWPPLNYGLFLSARQSCSRNILLTIINLQTLLPCLPEALAGMILSLFTLNQNREKKSSMAKFCPGGHTVINQLRKTLLQ